MTTPLLTNLSQVTGAVQATLESADASSPFGKLNVILMGDIHQFLPVASSKRELYQSNLPNNLCCIGRNLYEQFDTVIRLDEQMRIQDLVWEHLTLILNRGLHI